MADVPNAEHLLQDIAWLKSLATRLANDRDDADDLVQEARIAAWQRQPDTTRPMRGWLTKVVRDLAGMKRRSDRRRIARHELVDAAQSPATPDALLEQLRLQRRLADLVIELDEPYRSTIIARFVEGRTSASIALSLGIPAGTVRKRLHEALSRLRAKLDADAGERKQWAPAVIAFAKGGIQVAKPIKLVVVLVVLLLAGVAALMFVAPPRSSGGGGGTTASTAPATASGGAAPDNPNAIGDARASPQTAAERRADQRAAMLAAIAKARASRDHLDPHGDTRTRTTAPPTPPTSAGGSASAETTLDIVDNTGDTSEWAKRALRTLNSMLGQCYDLGLAEDPKLAGTIAIEFTLVGEPNVGGLLEHVDIVDAETTIAQHTFRDCLVQQLYSLELVPPPDGVTVKRMITLQVPN